MGGNVAGSLRKISSDRIKIHVVTVFSTLRIHLLKRKDKINWHWGICASEHGCPDFNEFA